MGARWKWLSVVRRKLAKTHPQNTIIVVHINNSRSLREDDEEEHEKHEQISCERTIVESKEVAETEEVVGDNVEKVDDDAASLARNNNLLEEHNAAVKIQSFFRGFLARRAFRALRSLVKVQALFRGVWVRKQQRLALHCMGALIRLQLRVRSRQLLMKASSSDN